MLLPAQRCAGLLQSGDLLPIQAFECFELLNRPIVLEGVRPERPVGADDTELDLFRVGRKAGIDGPAKKVRTRMLLAVPLHLTPQASAIHSPRLGNYVQIKHATERMADSVPAIIGQPF